MQISPLLSNYLAEDFVCAPWLCVRDAGCKIRLPVENSYISLCGPIEREGARLVIRIPLDAGGKQLRLVCEAISEIDADDLVVPVSDWLAEKIQVGEGTMVYVDDRNGKFNITKAPVD